MSTTSSKPIKIKPVAYKDLEIAKGVWAGGKNGSLTIPYKKEERYGAQFKPSQADKKVSWLKLKSSISAIVKARLKGSVKKGPVDYENLGELIASSIGKAFSSAPDSCVVTPEVSLVGKKKPESTKSQGVRIISEFIDPFQQFGDKEFFNGVKPRYVKIDLNDAGEPRLDAKGRGVYPLGKDTDANTRNGIREGIALNMLFGNADINAAGNMGKVCDKVVDKVGCIDFGHAFNSLIAGSAKLGGGVDPKANGNGILDYINRDTLLNFPTPSKSKLWRDFDGLIPSQEFADSLKKVAGNKKLIKEGLNEARAKLYGFAEELTTPDQQKMFLKSLQRLNKNIGQEKVDSKDIGEVIEKTLDNLGQFCEKRCDQMKEVAQMMELQAKIDTSLKEKGVDATLNNSSFQDKMSDISRTSSNTTWIRTGEKDKPFVGNLQGYIRNRDMQLKAAKIKEVAQLDIKEVAQPLIAAAAPKASKEASKKPAWLSKLLGKGKHANTQAQDNNQVKTL